MIISISILNKVVEYLAQRPFREVNELLIAIQKDLKHYDEKKEESQANADAEKIVVSTETTKPKTVKE